MWGEKESSFDEPSSSMQYSFKCIDIYRDVQPKKLWAKGSKHKQTNMCSEVCRMIYSYVVGYVFLYIYIHIMYMLQACI